MLVIVILVVVNTIPLTILDTLLHGLPGTLLIQLLKILQFPLQAVHVQGGAIGCC